MQELATQGQHKLQYNDQETRQCARHLGGRRQGMDVCQGVLAWLGAAKFHANRLTVFTM